MAEEMALWELRHVRKLTQIRMAKKLGITEDSVSRLEQRSDLLLSTLRKTIEAMGGHLSLVAQFPDREPVGLSGIVDDDSEAKPTGPRHALAKTPATEELGMSISPSGEHHKSGGRTGSTYGNQRGRVGLISGSCVPDI
jgi:hypothetical protein